MVTRLMREIVADAMLLHHPAAEIEVALPILDGVFQLRVDVRQPLLEDREVMRTHHFRDDHRRRFGVKNAAVGAARQQPEPRPQNEAIDVIVEAAAGPFGLHDDAVKIPLAAVRRLDRHCHVLAQQPIEIDVRVRRKGLDPIFEQTAHAFRSIQPGCDKLVLGQRGSQSGDTLALRLGTRKSHDGPSLPCSVVLKRPGCLETHF